MMDGLNGGGITAGGASSEPGGFLTGVPGQTTRISYDDHLLPQIRQIVKSTIFAEFEIMGTNRRSTPD